MKLATALVASVSIVIGIAACAAPEEHEETESSSQALCPKGQICTSQSYWWNTSSSSGFGGVLDPGTSTSSSGGTTTENACNVNPGGSFTCGGKVPTCGSIQKTTTSGCDLTLRCQVIGGVQLCDCIPGCGGGSWGFGSWNPCMYGHTYSCTPWGSCSCN